MPAPAPVQPPPPADDEKPAPAMPAAYLAVAERLDRQEDNPQVQHGYLAALKALESEPYRSSQHFAVVEARTKLQVAAGQATEARASLKAIREQHLARHAEEAKKLHDLALERFAMGAPHRRDRSALREALGDYLGAAEDLEQAARQEPAESDQAALERIYTARLKQVPEDPGTMFKLVKILVRKNRVDEAIALLNELQRFDAYQTRAVKILGLCHWQQNLHILAWQKFKQLPVTEDMKDILYRLGGDMERTDQLAAAASVYEHLVENDPDYRDASARLKKLQYRVKLQQDGSPSDSQKLLGVLNDPRFVVLEEINRGSMGIIYKAKDKTLEEIVALKILNDYLMSDPMAIERFKREARAAKRLGHPYIIRIHDMFESGSKRFISMEYIEGTDLKRLLSERTTFTEEMILYYMMQICDAIAYAHKLGVIHRDIKPANIMITKQNIVKIADFGIAKLLKGDDSTKSGTAVIGTPLYMAPEQITGSGVDMRSDIYSLGIVMYELVAGTPPFYLGNIEYHHIHTAPPPLPDRVSPEVRSIILKCIAKDPNDRYQTVDEILEALKQARKA
jgi:tRNA A-37 threonylcarbamoyl transferase component Bud32